MFIISIDTETGGFYPSIHALLSIGAACSWSSETFQEYITAGGQPQSGLPGGTSYNKVVDPEAAKINGYSWNEWERRGAVPIKTAMEGLRIWLAARLQECPRAIIICHNVEFDRSHLREAERQTGIELPHRHNWRCSQMKFGELMDKGVIAHGSAGLDRLGVLSGQWPEGGRPAIHGALEDAEAALKGYQWLLDIDRAQEDALRQLYSESLARRRMLEGSLPADQQDMDGLACILRIFRERCRQVHVEGWCPTDDDKYINGELVDAAIAYLMITDPHGAGEETSLQVWPWEPHWFKPHDSTGAVDVLRCYEKAGALIAAENDRQLRGDGAASVTPSANGKEGA